MGEPVAQQDWQPLNNFAPTHLWTAGLRVVDQYAIPLPADLPPGRYEVRTGLYTAAGRLPVSAATEKQPATTPWWARSRCGDDCWIMRTTPIERIHHAAIKGANPVQTGCASAPISEPRYPTDHAGESPDFNGDEGHESHCAHTLSVRCWRWRRCCCCWRLWLRWQYVQTISLYVDEFTTLWAARRTLELGAPLMPSGVLYTRGLLATYVTALAGLLAGGLTYTVGRLPSVLFGLATIVAVFGVGRREWNSRVGWLAALGLALLPEAIIWSGRARFYAQLQFFVLLALWAAYAAMEAPGRGSTRPEGRVSRDDNWSLPCSLCWPSSRRNRRCCSTRRSCWRRCWWRGWRYLLRPQVWPAHLICVLALGVRFAVEIVGQPGYFETIQAERPYVGLILDLPAAWGAYAPLLLGPERLPWTLLGLLAVAAALVALGRGGWRVAASIPLSPGDALFCPAIWLCAALHPALCGRPVARGALPLPGAACWLLLVARGA